MTRGGGLSVGLFPSTIRVHGPFIVGSGSGLTSSIRRVAPSLGRVYRYVGVEAFRWVLRQTPFGWLNPAVRMTARKSDLEPLLRQMNFAEGAHLIGGAITLSLAIGYAITGHRKVGLSFAVIALLVHFYPMITQRWNRGRVARVVRRITPEAARSGNA